ncbi:nucleoporin NUP62 [Acrasis kona]|uniref:Nucleoporin NUP62 n=1 Tax=Acrasis kona TaxID=1008807 RepID=A0AAW2YNK8_9EUKA
MEALLPTGASIPVLAERDVITKDETRRIHSALTESHNEQLRSKADEQSKILQQERLLFNQRVEAELREMARESYTDSVRKKHAVQEQKQSLDKHLQSLDVKQTHEKKLLEDSILERKRLENEAEQSRRQDLLKRVDKIKSRSHELEEQVKNVKSIRKSEKDDVEKMTKDLMSRWENNMEVRRKLYFCDVTKKVLPSSEFNHLVPQVLKQNEGVSNCIIK